MRLLSLRLENIRSYVSASIAFPVGITLLAGDIGAGKSTLLLALEFALFGVQRGEIGAAGLLRHGARNGAVTLTLEIEGKTVVITRSLKRSSQGISQEAGTLVVDGVQVEATAQELKARILGLLRYPPSLLSKGKSPLFRYTVYTPQEEMKSILYETADERLETLRKLFDMDKYKRVAENGVLLVRELKKEEAIVAARIDELSRTLMDEARLRERQMALESSVAEKSVIVKKTESEFQGCQAALDVVDKERFLLEEKKKQHAVAQNSLTHCRSRLEEGARERKRIAGLIAETETQLAGAVTEDGSLAEREAKLLEHEKLLAGKERDILRLETTLHDTILRSTKTITGISSLTTCPTCAQSVDDAHKLRIKNDEEAKIVEAKGKLATLDKVKQELNEKRRQFDLKKAELLQRQKLVEANKVTLHSLGIQRDRLKLLDELREKLRSDEANAVAAAERLSAELKSFSAFDEEGYRLRKAALEAARRAHQAAAIALAERKRDQVALHAELEKLNEKKKEKGERERELAVLRKRTEWLNRHLLPVASGIEKALFSSVYHVFNDAFRDWFAALIEDEALTVRLDSAFTPVLTQNGYETSIDHLSGGEKTSVALAYRLALNKAVNEFLNMSATRDLLILDEPTDGFSGEQLDRVRDILGQLKLQQIIIVSHEEQLEGYADHVLRVSKSGHESRVEA